MNKLASKIASFLKKADVNALGQLWKVRQAAKTVFSLKDLFLNAAGGDIYTGPSVDLENALDQIDSQSRSLYWQASKNGISAQQSAKYLGSLQSAASDVKSIVTEQGDERKLSKPLDPMAIGKLNDLLSALHNTIPVDIPAPAVAHPPAPQGNPLDFYKDDTGIAQEKPGANSSDLSGVAEGLAQKDFPSSPSLDSWKL